MWKYKNKKWNIKQKQKVLGKKDFFKKRERKYKKEGNDNIQTDNNKYSWMDFRFFV